jgi:hypothetical protein
MNPIRIPITLSQHIVGGKPRGFYLLAQRLFPNGAPILRKDQFVGFNGSLIVTVARHNAWDSLLKLGVYADIVEINKHVIWFERAALYPMSKGFRMYIPGTVLTPTMFQQPVHESKIETTGIFHKHDFCGGVEPLFYLEIPLISADVLLGRKQL